MPEKLKSKPSPPFVNSNEGWGSRKFEKQRPMREKDESLPRQMSQWYHGGPETSIVENTESKGWATRLRGMEGGESN